MVVGVIFAGTCVLTSAQDFDGYRLATKQFEDNRVAEKIDANELSVDPGWRKWAFELLVAFATLPDAPRPARFKANAAEFDRVWQKLLDQPGHGDDAIDHLALAAKDGFNIAFQASPLAALNGVSELLKRPGLDDTAELLILTIAAQGHWENGQRGAFEDLMGEAATRLNTDEAQDSTLLAEARLYYQTSLGRAFISDGRPDLAYGPLEKAARAGERILTLGGSAKLWIAAAVKQLDLAHASDDVAGGRKIAAKTLANEAWNRVEDPLFRSEFEWRRLALELIGKTESTDATDAALDGLEAIMGETHHTNPDWPAEVTRIGRYHTRAAIRLGRTKRAERVLDRLEGLQLIKATTLAALRARIEFEESGPGPELSFDLVTAVRARLAAFANSGSEPLARGLLHFDSDAELVSLAIESILSTAGEEGALSALQLLTEVQAVGGLAQALKARPLTGPEISKLCPDGGGLLVLTPGYEYDHGFLIDQSDVSAFRIDGVSATHRLRRSLGRALRSAIQETDPLARSEVDRLGEELSERLFDQATAQRIGSWREMTVVGLDAWGDIPLELLTVGGSRLGERLALSYVPSLPVAYALAERAEQKQVLPNGPARSANANPIALTVATDLDAQMLERFDGAERLGSAREVGRSLVPEALQSYTSSLLDDDATLEGWLNQLKDEPLVSIFVGHGVRTIEGQQALLLWGGTREGGLITNEVVQSVQVPELVVLGSCEAGRSIYLRGGDGSDGLDAAFLAAGAVAAVTSNVPISLGSATQQCRAILAECGLGGATVSSALLAGRRAAPEDLGAWTMRVQGHGQLRPWATPIAPRVTRGRTSPWPLRAACIFGLALAVWALTRLRKWRTSFAS